MSEVIYITNENIKKYAKVQGASPIVDRRKVIIMWDELDAEGKRLARNHIEIDEVEVETSDPYNVPDKWKDCINEREGELEASDLIKQVIANPSRSDVYDILMDNQPPEPLMLWWLNVCFSNPDYFELLAEACTQGLFRTDTRYLWGAVAFGVDAGEGKFYWPSKDDGLTKEEKEAQKTLIEEYNIPKKEVELAWDEVGQLVIDNLSTDHESDASRQREDEEGSNPSTLLDF